MIKTQRLHIKDLSLNDAKRMSEYRDKKEVANFQSWNRYSVKQATKRIAYCLKHPLSLDGGNYQVGIYLKDNDFLIGDLYIEINGGTSFTLGYTLDSDYWSNGYGSEAVSAMIDYMKTTYHFKRCICRVYLDNKRSIHLLEKLGFHRISQSRFFQDALYTKDLDTKN